MPSRRQQRQQMLKDEDKASDTIPNEEKVLGLEVEPSKEDKEKTPEEAVEELTQTTVVPDAKPADTTTTAKTKAAEPKVDEVVNLDPTAEPSKNIIQDTTASNIPTSAPNPELQAHSSPATVTVASFGNTQKPASEAYAKAGEEQGNLQKEWLSFLTFLGNNEARRVMSGTNWKYKLRQAIGNVEF